MCSRPARCSAASSAPIEAYGARMAGWKRLSAATSRGMGVCTPKTPILLRATGLRRSAAPAVADA